MAFSSAGCDNVEVLRIGATGLVHAKNAPALRDRRPGKRRSLEHQLLQDLSSRSRTAALTRDVSVGRGREETAIAVVGLGYVGLPVALALSRRSSNTPVFGFDTSAARLAELRRGFDKTGETSHENLLSADITFVNDPDLLKSCSFFVVAVPTPVDQHRRPDLRPL